MNITYKRYTIPVNFNLGDKYSIFYISNFFLLLFFSSREFQHSFNNKYMSQDLGDM